MRFDVATPPHVKSHTSKYLGVKYFVDPKEVPDYTSRQWSQLDSVAEKRYMHHLNVQCDVEQNQRARMMQEAQGWFFQDEDIMDKARKLPMKNCNELNKLTRKTQQGYSWGV